MTTTTSSNDASGPARPVVVGFDDSEPSFAAVRWAAREAAARDVPLKIVSSFLPEDFSATEEETDRMMATMVQRAVDEARSISVSLRIEQQVFDDLAVPMLLRESAHAALLVVGARGRGGFKGLLIGSVARQCVHRAQGPVAVIHQESVEGAGEAAGSHLSGATGQEVTVGSVVVGVDGSACSNEALRWAADEAGVLGCPLRVITVWHWPYSYGWAAAPSNFDPADDAAAILKGAVSPIRATHPELTIVDQVVEGWPAQVLTQCSSGAALLVVGSRGLGALAEMWLGSVSEYCVSHAHSPVVVLHGGASGGSEHR
jgi:nucleotide-binding universal stress UspA family protein